jgi:hypothetical protein
MATTLQSRTDRPFLERERSSVVAGSAWMVGITLLLFFLPLLNGVIGGFIGGYKVGGVRRAMLAAILPAIIVAVGLWIIFAIGEAPVWGVLAGLTGATLVALADLGIFVGAAIGGALSNRRAEL